MRRSDEDTGPARWHDDVGEGTAPDTVPGTPPADELPPGIVLDRYIILHRIGTGGMGVVYAAHDPDLDRRIAIKLLHPRGPAQDGGRERLQREAQAMARLSHPAVVPVFDVGSHGDRLFVAMALVEGQTLGHWLRQNHPGWRDALAIVMHAGRGLAAAHGAGIVHRDFKPDNVLVGRDARVQVTDFGLARLTDDEVSTDPADAPPRALPARLTRPGAIMGTPAYMAPEQHLGRPASARADQFSFCVALYEAIYGQHPFRGDERDDVPSALAVAAEVMSGRVRPPPRGTKVPTRLHRILLRGLAVDPERRWPSVDALLDALEQAATRRGRWPPRVAAAGVIAAAALTSVWLGRARDTPAAHSGPAAPASLVLKLNPERLQRLTFTDGCDENPAFDADERTVYYDGAVGQDYRLFSLDLATGQIHELTHTRGWDLAPAPSPDGARIAFLRRAGEPTAAFVADLPGLERPRRIGPGGFRPTWSPDGRHLWTGNGNELVRHDLATDTAARRLVPPAGELPLQGIELPDGRLLLLTTREDGTTVADGVAIYPAGEPTPRWLLHGVELEEVLTLTPERDAALVARVTATQAIEIVRVPLDGSAATPLTGNSVGARKRLALSRDATRLVWSDCVDRTRLAMLQTPAGLPPRLVDLAPARWNDVEPVALGTDGLLFLSDRSGATGLWQMRSRDPGQAQPVPLGDIEPAKVAASADGRLLAIADHHAGLFIAPLDGSTPPRLLIREPGQLNPTIDRHGRLIYFERNDSGQLRIAAVPITGGAPTWILPPGTLGPAASPTADLLAYLAGTPGQNRPMLLDLKTGRSRPLLPDELPLAWRHLRFSSDGRRLLLIWPNGRLVELDLPTGRTLRQLDPGSDGFLGATFLGDDIIVGRTGWTGDLWLATHRREP